MAEAIEAIGEKKKSVQDIMAQMQAQYLAMDAVSAGAPVAGVSAGTDEGLRIVNGGKKSGVMSANDSGSIAIGNPNLPVNADVRALMERAIAHIQLETTLPPMSYRRSGSSRTPPRMRRSMRPS